MSLFYASATPMLKTLSDATSKFVSDVSSCTLSLLIQGFYVFTAGGCFTSFGTALKCYLRELFFTSCLSLLFLDAHITLDLSL